MITKTPTIRVNTVESGGRDDGHFALAQGTLARVEVHAGCVYLLGQKLILVIRNTADTGDY